MFSKKTKYVRTDAWRGYVQPVYAVVGWNDTGNFSDSPCRTDTGIAESKLAKEFLRKNKIPFKTMVCESSNVFCAHKYLIVPTELVEKTKILLKNWYENGIKQQTTLLYLV